MMPLLILTRYARGKMRITLSIVERNLKIYIRDKTSVFFSMFSVIILLFLYMFFLADLQAGNVASTMNNLGIPFEMQDVDNLINGWLIAGLLSVNTITMPIFMLSKIVEDRSDKIDYDFMATPAKRYQIVLGYIIASWVVSLMSSILVIVIGEAYIIFNGGTFIGFLPLLKALGIITLSILMTSGLFYIIMMLLKTNAQASTVNTLVGTLAGFIGGIYVPLGFLGFVGTVATVFPLAHTASLLRKVYMQSSMSNLFANAPEVVGLEIKEFLGVNLVIGNHTFSTIDSFLLLVGFTLVGYIVSIILYSKVKRRS